MEKEFVFDMRTHKKKHHFWLVRIKWSRLRPAGNKTKSLTEKKPIMQSTIIQCNKLYCRRGILSMNVTRKSIIINFVRVHFIGWPHYLTLNSWSFIAAFIIFFDLFCFVIFDLLVKVLLTLKMLLTKRVPIIRRIAAFSVA